MKFLIDTNPPKVQRLVKKFPDFVAGQLIVPSRTRRNWGGVFACDNSAYVNFIASNYRRMLTANSGYASRCLFVTCQDVVGNAKQTMELWKRRTQLSSEYLHGFKLAFVAQDGVEDMEIPWDEMDAFFVGGLDPWKDSRVCRDLVREANRRKKHTHCGRVNTIKRYRLFAECSTDTCDGSGVARYDHMLPGIVREFTAIQDSPKLFPLTPENQ